MGNKPHRCGAGRAAVCAPAARGGSHAGCGLCAPAARGRGRGRGRESGERRSGQRRETAERRGARAAERDSIADGTALRYIVGEEVAATFGDTEDLFPEGSLFMSLRAIGYLLTHAACLLSVRQKKENFAEQRQRREVYRTPYWGERKKSFGQPAVNEVNTLLKKEKSVCQKKSTMIKKTRSWKEMSTEHLCWMTSNAINDVNAD